MEICVCLKQVPETQDVGLDKDTHTLQRDAATLILNPADAAALELAYRLKKRGRRPFRAAGKSLRLVNKMKSGGKAWKSASV